MKKLTFISLLCASFSLAAGGSFSVATEFAPIKAQIPELWQALTSAFTLEDSGMANMIGNEVNPALGHRRIGPYCLVGKAKNPQGNDKLLFCFNTDYVWLDKKGKETVMEKAVDVKEKFTSLEITPLQP